MELISTFPALPLQYGCKIVIQALDPTTDAVVTGVKVVNPVCYGLDLTGGAAPITPVPAIAPLWVPEPLDDQTDSTTEAPADEPVAAGS